MRVGDLPGNDFQLRPFGRDHCHQTRIPRQQGAERRRTGQVEQGVGRCRPFCVPALPDGCQHRRDRGADVIPQQHRQCPCKAQQTAALRPGPGRNALKHRNGGRAALHRQGHAEACQQAQPRMMPHPCQPERKHRALCQRGQRRAHISNALEQQAKGEHRPANCPGLLPCTGKAEQQPGQQHKTAHIFQPESQQLCGNGGSDVAAKDHRDRLPQGQQARTYKAQHHHRDCRAALQHRRDRSPRQHAPHRAAGQHHQQPLHPLPCRCFQTAAERIHAIQKQCQTAKKRKDHFQPLFQCRRPSRRNVSYSIYAAAGRFRLSASLPFL